MPDGLLLKIRNRYPLLKISLLQFEFKFTQERLHFQTEARKN